MRAITHSVPSLIALALALALLAGLRGALAQPLAPDPTLDATQLAGRNLFTQHCVVCHVKTLVTAVRSYGPSLSRQTLGGQEDVMRELISNGTPSMPGFKYSLAPNEIGAIIAYLKTLPVPPPAAAPPAPAPH